MEGHVNTYGGINQDAAYDSIKPNMYIDAKDIRISTDTGESQGAFTNMKGNTLSFVIPIRSDLVPSGNAFGAWNTSSPEIIGYTTIRNSIILFVADGSNTKGWIYEVQYDLATREVDPAVYPKLIYYNELLFFKKEWPIEALGRFENESTQKIYWTDYNNLFRTINIADPDLNTFPVSNVDIYPDIKYTQPILESIAGGGKLNSGKYQIAYRLITSDGKETLISPPSNMIHIVISSEYDSVPRYVGEPIKIDTGKSINISIDTTNYLNVFEKIEILALYYENDTATPTAVSVESQILVNNTTNVTYTGSENTIFDIELFTFASKNFAFKTFKSVTQKDNYLVGANIKSSTIDVQSLLEGGQTFSALTRRHNNVASGKATPFTPGSADNDLNNAFNANYNKDKHWDITWQLAANQFKYQANGTTLGGQGANISYKFHIEPMTVDVETQPGFHNIGGNVKYGNVDNHNLNDGYGVYPNPSFANNASPHISGLLRGYKRGETYRFGIVFYTLKGEATYVEYIGDIKFPDISEKDGANNLSNSPYFPLSTAGTELATSVGPVAIGFNLGIEFTITLPTSLSNKITGYQIIRVPRTNNDKRRLCQGIVNPLAHFRVSPTSGNKTPHDYDFRIDNTDNVVHQNNFLLGLAPTSGFSGVDFLELDSARYFIDEHDPDNNFTPPNHQAATTRAQHLSFYSPEISYAHTIGTTIPDIATNLGNRPCLLITGYYSFVNNPASGGSPIDYYEARTTTTGPSAAALGSNVTQISDVKHKLLRTLPVTFNSIENIKEFNNATYFDMRDSTNVYLDTKTASWGTPFHTAAAASGPSMGAPSYCRNYYAFPGSVNNSKNLNDPDNTEAVIARAGTNISGLVKQFSNDPLNPTTAYTTPGTNQSRTDYHIFVNNTTYAVTPNNPQIAWLTKDGNPVPSSGAGSYGSNRILPIADIVIPRNEVYGGSNTSALESNTFIEASPFIDKANLNPKVFGGDIFISMSHIQKGMTEFKEDFYGGSDYDSPFTNTLLLVTESSVNTNLAHGATTTTGVEFTHNSSQSPYFRQEDNNDKTNYAKLEAGETLYDFYGYNNVFSRINKEVAFFVKPANLTDLSLTNDVRAFLSAVKVNGENIDSWTKFAINDYYDVDDHGPINKILNFKDDVYFVQNEGIGNYSINREAVTTTDDGVPTELGTAKGWGKHRYLSKEIGSIHQWAVKATNTAIYFFDAIHRKIYMLGAGKTGMQNSPLSELKGMHSFLQELGDGVFARKETGGDNPILLKGAHIGTDEINDEVIFTFLTSNFYGPVQVLAVLTTYAINTLVDVSGIIRLMTSEVTTTNTIEGARSEVTAASTVIALDRIKDTSIVYDELAAQFSTRLSINPKIWINSGDNLMTSDYDPTVSVTTNIYTHNIGNWGEFYGTQEECELTLVINPKADLNKVLRTLEFNSIVRNDDKQITRTETITAFRVKTETQDSGKINYSAGRIKRRFDKWRIKLPRDINSTSQKGRFRSTHFLLTLYFDNTTNKELIMNRLISYYDPQIF